MTKEQYIDFYYETVQKYDARSLQVAPENWEPQKKIYLSFIQELDDLTKVYNEENKE